MASVTNKYSLHFSVEKTNRLLVQFLKQKELVPQEVRSRGRTLLLDSVSFERELLRNLKRSNRTAVDELYDKTIAYCKILRKDRWPAFEEYLLETIWDRRMHFERRCRRIEIAVFYAAMVIEDRWIEAEPIFRTYAYSAAQYAKQVIRGRWIQAEPVILRDIVVSSEYAMEVMRQRWDEFEHQYRIHEPRLRSQLELEYVTQYRIHFNLGKILPKVKYKPNWHKEGF